MNIIDNISYNDKKECVLKLYLPEKEEFDLLIYLHGGGLTGGDRHQSDVMKDTLIDNNIAMASIEYRMYPNAKYPDFIEDGADGIEYIKDNIAKYGKVKRIFLCGVSAGAYISMMLCFDDTYFEKRNLKLNDIAGFIFTAGQPTTHFNVLKEMGLPINKIVIDERAPMYYLKQGKKYPPFLITISDNDIKGRLEQTEFLIKSLETYGFKDISYKLFKGEHCDYLFEENEKGENVLAREIIDFINNI